jgi:transposase
MKILALDLGKGKSVACVFESSTGEHCFDTAPTSVETFRLMLEHHRPERVVIEISPLAGWVGDLVRSLGLELQVANVNHDAWRWRNIKRKTDRLDALKLARLSAMNQLPLVHLPEVKVREWRGLIEYRQSLVSRRRMVKNRIRAILAMQALPMPPGKSGWSVKSVAALREQAYPLSEVGPEALWRGQLELELRQFDQLQELLRQVDEKLDGLADSRVMLLVSIPGVGKRLAEMVVTAIDDPHRFKNGKQVGAYVGLTPRQYQSGSMDRQGRISGQGHRHLRALLVEVSWLGLQYNPWMREVYERVSRGSRVRRKTAICAVARRLLIRCWAMLRDGTRWSPPPQHRPARAA